MADQPTGSGSSVAPQDGGDAPLICDYYDTAIVSHVSDALLTTLATACVEKTAGDLFRQPDAVIEEVKKELLNVLNAQSEAYQKGQSTGVPLDSPRRLLDAMLDTFVQSKRSILNRMTSGLRFGANGERKDEAVEELVEKLAREGSWMHGRRDALAKALVQRVDSKRMSHCGAPFPTPDALAEHKRVCDFRPEACAHGGCSEVVSALHAPEHDAACAHKPLPCEQGCGESVPRGEMDKHCVSVCPMKPVQCPFRPIGCSEPLVRGSVEEHCRGAVAEHLLLSMRAVARQQLAGDDHAQRIVLLEKAYSLQERFEAVSSTTLALKLKDAEVKIGSLEVEARKLRAELKAAHNTMTEVAKLKREMEQLKKALKA